MDENGRNRCPAGGTEEDIHREVLLYVHGVHDLVTLELPVPPNDGERFGWSLAYALLGGFQIAYGAEDSELGAHLFDVPGEGSRKRVLFYETDEGGTGLLRNLWEAEGWRRTARRALELLHVDPESGRELEGACERACYDCLLSYYNQGYHDLLDRRGVVEVLQRLLESDLDLTGEDVELGWEELKANAIGAEPGVIEDLERRGFPKPAGQHCVVRDGEGIAVTEADLLYPNRIVVWVHGSPHHQEHVQRRDDELERRLRALGYRVVILWPERIEQGLRDLAERLDRSDLLRVAPVLRLVPRQAAEPFVRHLPVYDLRAAAGAFSEGQVPEELGWLEVTDRRIADGMFVAQLVGKSMNRRIPNGSYCIFRQPVAGSRQGRVLLVQHRDIADPEHGGHYTVKVYESEKVASPDGGWRHGIIRLKPDSTDARFEPLVLQNVDKNEIAVVAEFVQVLAS